MDEKSIVIAGLVRRRVFENDFAAEKEIRARAERVGIWFDSAFRLYEEIAAGRVGGFTVPAINIRTLTFDIARLIFQMMSKCDVGPVIFEIARSEIGYTNQPVREYATVILAAALAEKYRGPVFVQADHFQVNAKNYFRSSSERVQELQALQELVEQAIEAGVYNIDIDSSTLVQLEMPDIASQQAHNIKVTTTFVNLIRALQPKDITITIGGEIGEVGKKNSTPEELEVFVRGVHGEVRGGIEGLSKVSVQTGTSHGGVVGPDGKLLQVSIDFDALRQCSQRAKELGLAGVVQHGASTLPMELFDKFPETGCVEIHLATEFQNIIYKHLPEELRKRIYQYCKENFQGRYEWKPELTEEQGIYKTRKRALGPFKHELWDLPEEVKTPIIDELSQKFALLFEKLGLLNTRHIIDKLYPVKG